MYYEIRKRQAISNTQDSSMTMQAVANKYLDAITRSTVMSWDDVHADFSKLHPLFERLLCVPSTSAPMWLIVLYLAVAFWQRDEHHSVSPSSISGGSSCFFPVPADEVKQRLTRLTNKHCERIADVNLWDRSFETKATTKKVGPMHLGWQFSQQSSEASMLPVYTNCPFITSFIHSNVPDWITYDSKALSNCLRNDTCKFMAA